MTGISPVRRVLAVAVAALAAATAGCSSTSSNPSGSGTNSTTSSISSTTTSAAQPTGSSSSTSAASGSSGATSAAVSSTGSAPAKDLGTLTVITAISKSTPYIGVESVQSDPSLDPWKPLGLTVKFVAGKTSTVTPALASGSADIGVTAGNEAALGAVQGAPVVIPACIMGPWRQNIIVGKDITQISQLKGKTLGISAAGSAGAYATGQVLKNQGWKSSDVKIQPLGTVAALEAALKNGVISAFIWNPAVANDLKAQGVANDLGSVQDLVGPNCFESFEVPASLMQSRPDAVKAFFQGYFSNVAYLKAHEDVAQQIVVKDWNYSASTVGNYLPDDLAALSSDGKMTSDQVAGLVDATQYVQPSATAAQVKKAISYWQDLP